MDKFFVLIFGEDEIKFIYIFNGKLISL